MGGWVAGNQKQKWQGWRFWPVGGVVLLLTALLWVQGAAAQTSAAPARSPSPTRPAAVATPSAAPRLLELSLETAIRLALQHNLDIERERYSPQIARTEVQRNRAAFDPTVGVDTQASQVQNLPVNRTLQFDSEGNIVGERIFRQFVERAEVTPYWRHKILLGGNYELRFINTRESVTPAQIGTTSRIVDPRSESRFQFTFTQPVLRDFGIAVNTAVIRQAEKSELIAEQQVLQVILDTIFATQQRYWELVFRIQDLAVKRESQKLAEDFLAENTVRVELGTLAPIELVQARTQVKMREGEVIVAESAVGQAEDLVKEILGLPDTVGDWQIQLRPTDSPLFEPITVIPVEAMVTAALQQRPDFVQSQLDIAIREIARQLARNQRLPRLDVVGRSSVSAFGESIAESIYDYKEGDGYDWALGLQFQYPLGNRQARNDFLRRDLELQQALVTQRRLIRTIIRDIRQGIREIETASKRVEVTRQATELARTQLEAEQEKFRLGLSTSFNVLEFQEDLAIARTDETRALSDYNVALARLDQLTGKMQYDDFATPKK